ncbi:hypothetical protein TSUD_170530 [Trifolium subterraneum]|uniref:Uncharacterized protein n=1 Tax=Trifolium subterraneum TaxID=3900 RepID=A0A2Z6MNF8_TRISU|nr:hypothetical protein TSUD_170530 [Trifolium subterraneum]
MASTTSFSLPYSVPISCYTNRSLCFSRQISLSFSPKSSSLQFNQTKLLSNRFCRTIQTNSSRFSVRCEASGTANGTGRDYHSLRN